MTEKTIFPADATQNFVEIDKIVDDVVVLKDGSLKAVLIVSGINFELKSEEEQEIVTATYQNFLNSLDFSIQIIVHSRKINLDNYIEKLKVIKEKEENSLLKNQSDEYIKFIEEFIKQNEIMDKNFFIVVPYQFSGTEEIKKSFSFLSSIPFFKKKKNNKKEEEESMSQKVIQLQRRVDQIIAELTRIGLRSVRLNREELLELYYNIYNPSERKRKLSGV